MRKPLDTTHISLRLREELRHRLEQKAAQHRLTLAGEIRIRLEDSIENEIEHRLETVAEDIEKNWHRFSARFLRMDLADQLADALVNDEDPKKIKTLAHLIIEHRATERRPGDVS
jgi:hypothetical protein